MEFCENTSQFEASKNLCFFMMVQTHLSVSVRAYLRLSSAILLGCKDGLLDGGCSFWLFLTWIGRSACGFPDCCPYLLLSAKLMEPPLWPSGGGTRGPRAAVKVVEVYFPAQGA